MYSSQFGYPHSLPSQREVRVLYVSHLTRNVSEMLALLLYKEMHVSHGMFS